MYMYVDAINVYGRHTDDLTFSLCINFACVHKCLCLNNFMIDSIIPCYGCEWKIHFLTFKTPGQKLQKKVSVFISNIPSLLTQISLSYNWKKSIILGWLSECLLTAFFPEIRLRKILRWYWIFPSQIPYSEFQRTLLVKTQYFCDVDVITFFTVVVLSWCF